MSQNSDIVALLRAASLRATVPRIRILEALLHAPCPLSLAHVRAAVPEARCDFVTVYRILAAFEKVGFVRRVFQSDGTALFIACDGEPPLFVVNRETHEVQPLDERDIGRVRELALRVSDYLASRGYRGVTPHIQFFASGTAPGTNGCATDRRNEPGKRGGAVRRKPTGLANLRFRLECSASLYPSPCTQEDFQREISAVFARPGSLESLSALGAIHMWAFLIKDRLTQQQQQQLVSETRMALKRAAEDEV